MKPDQTYDGDNGWVAIPTLSALIHGCRQYRPEDKGDGFHWFVLEEQKDGRWAAGFDDFVPLDRIGQGATPEEACSELWMVLKYDNEKTKAKN